MKILIVEDNPGVMELLTLALQKQKFSIDKASEGNDAFEKARNNRYDVIILDLMLPENLGSKLLVRFERLK